MKLLASSHTVIAGFLFAVGAFGGCGSGTDVPTPLGSKSASSGGSTYGPSSTSSGSSGSGTPSSTSSGGGSSGAPLPPSGDDASDVGSDGAVAAEASSEGGSASDDGQAAAPDAPSCVKGQVPTSKVVVIGDSYLDHAGGWSNAIPFLYTDLRSAGSLGMSATYREYQLGGAAMNYGTLNLSIPYQYETTAKGDLAVMNPKDIDTILMDGGGNDVLIDNQGCMTNAQPPPGNATCATAIQATVDRASKLLQEAAADGVKHVVYVFYPHLDPAGGGILPTPAPQVNATLDYAYPLAETVCCGAPFTSSATSYTCSGNASGTECVFIDIRPAFEGHVADYIKSDHVHPTDAGAKVIADLIAGAMHDHCIAQ